MFSLLFLLILLSSFSSFGLSLKTKAVTIYRLLCGKTYEMKMIERASHKLALDKAVLGTHGGAATQLSKKEVERLLKEGAYDFFSDQVSVSDGFAYYKG